MNKVLGAIALAAVVSFTGCGDEESSTAAGNPDIYSCDMVTSGEFLGMEINSHVCFEIATADKTDDTQCQGGEEMGITITATEANGCPAGATISCEEESEDGVTGTTYYYGEEYNDMTCEQIAEENAEMDAM